MSAVLKHIAAIAKGLSKAELHVLIELTSRAEQAGGHDANASSRELAEATGLARSSVQLALDSLHKKGIILSDSGTASKAAMHRLLFLDAVEIQSGGSTFGPGRPGFWATPEREIKHLPAPTFVQHERVRGIDRKERCR